MKIMVKASGNDKWQKVDERAFGKEAELQELLSSNPDLIPVELLGDERKPIRIWLREASLPGSGHTDLIGVDEDGNISIIEAKLASNQEIKRKVIGQILEYAVYLWKKPYAEFDEIVRSRRGRELVELMQEAPKEEDQDWVPEEFQKAVADNLKYGRFGLFVVVDEINEELRRIIDFVNSKDLGDLQLHALELKYFQTNQGEVVLPQMYGAAEVPRERPEVPAWDEARFFSRAEEALKEPKTLGILRDLYVSLREHGYQVKWGKRGTREGRAVFCLPDPDARDGFITVLRFKTDGTMKLGLGRLPSEIGPENAVVVARRLLKTVDMPTIQKWADESFFLNERALNSGWPGGGKRINTLLPDAQAVKQFKDGLLAFADTVGQ
jgi:hypothetical protein